MTSIIWWIWEELLIFSLFCFLLVVKTEWWLSSFICFLVLVGTFIYLFFITEGLWDSCITSSDVCDQNSSGKPELLYEFPCTKHFISLSLQSFSDSFQSFHLKKTDLKLHAHKINRAKEKEKTPIYWVIPNSQFQI